MEYLSFKTLQVVPLWCFPAVFASVWLQPISFAVPASGDAASRTLKKKEMCTAWPVWRRCGDVFPARIKRSAAWLLQMLSGQRGDDGKGKVTGRQSGRQRTHGSVYGRLMYGPDRRARADYLSGPGTWANLRKTAATLTSPRKENNHFWRRKENLSH